MTSAFFRFALITLLAITHPYTYAEGEIKGPNTQAQPQKPAARLWNLQDADILSIINEVSLETGKNFIVDPRVSGKVTLVSSKPIKPNEVYDIFLSVLSLLGYSAIPEGDVTKIVPNTESGEYATRVASKKTPGKGDEVVVRIIGLNNVSANQVIPIIRPLLPQWSNVTAYPPGNVLILLGRASNLERMIRIINTIDKTSDNNIEAVPLHQASAAQMANILNNLQNASRTNGNTSTISIAADERSNRILLSGNKSDRLHLRQLIAQLDTPSTGSQGNTEVVYLRYLQAKNFAPILGKIADNLLGKEKGKMTVTTSSSQNGNTTDNTSNSKETETLTSIQAEPSTNSLVITAPPALMKALNSVITKLDIRPAQVLVEAIIVEIEQRDMNNLGIIWGQKISIPSNTQNTNTPQTFTPELIPGTIGIIPSQQIQAVLSALQDNINVNILSTPSIVVLDNHKAEVSIGQDIPVTTGQYATSSSAQTATPFTTTAYKQVALSLSVTPQINLGNAIRMTVALKNDSLQNPANPGPDPAINTSKINNSVIVNSTDILVLGGLIRNTVNDSITKIPILGDIPILGWFFQHQNRSLEKRNLVVFLKPTIMHNTDDAMALTHTKYDAVRQAQINWPVDLSDPNAQKAENILPLWKRNVTLPKPFES